MKNRPKTALTLIAGLSLATLITSAEAQPYAGRQLMTPEEWAAHRATMWRLPPGEQEAYRARHHEEMRRRAEAMGFGLPAQPPPVGMGRGGPMGSGAWGPGYGRWEPGYGGQGWGRYGPGRRR